MHYCYHYYYYYYYCGLGARQAAMSSATYSQHGSQDWAQNSQISQAWAEMEAV